jgi:hypothetical protein
VSASEHVPKLSAAANSIRSGFITIDVETNTIRQIIAVQHNPNTVSRTLDAAAVAPPGSEPHEQLTVQLAVDATIPPAPGQTGVYPMLSALELLLYVPAVPLNRLPLIVFVWGRRRVLPVRILQLQIVEQSFDAELNPVRAEIAVTLKILKEADLAAGSSGRTLWDAHVRQLQALAATLPQATLADLGLTGEIAPLLGGRRDE